MAEPFFHSDILAKLTNEAVQGRVAQGLMLCGPKGTGKLYLALKYARYLGCDAPKTDGEACGECPSCHWWNALAHPDVHFVYPVVKDTKRKRETCDDYLPQWRLMIKENPYTDLERWTRLMEASTNVQPLIYARESDILTHKLSLKAGTQTGRRVVIVWLPECLHEACANKLLKLLEEPPRGTVFLMVSEEPEHVMATVRSRVQRIDVPPISEETLVKELIHYKDIEFEKAEEAARRAAGSWQKALENITGDEERETMLQDFMALMRLAWTRRAREMKNWSEMIAVQGRTKQTAFLQYTERMLRESFISNFHLPELDYMSQKEREFVQRFAPYVNERNVQQLATLTAEAQEHIERNVNPRMVFFDYILRVTVMIKA